MSDPNCPFCKIVKGEIESKTVYSDSKVMAVLDINPATKGHVLIFPKAHHSIMPVIPPDEFKHLVKKAYCLSQSIKSSVASTSSKIFIANGGVAGQQSSHFLMHIIPDGSLFNIFGNQEVDNTAYEALKKNVGIMMGNHYKREGKIHNPIETSNLFEKENFS
ncbi:HIT domain-containing protein, partial [archaeon]|nr:HIT domain-containing protein [archaeon]